MPKILGIQFGKAEPQPIQMVETQAMSVNNPKVVQTFSTPLGKIGKGDITKPYINAPYIGNEGYVWFGMDNLYPQLIDQMYYQSPLHASIINYKVNASIGGGFQIINGAISGIDKVEEYRFLKKNKINEVLRGITYDIIMHGRTHLVIHKDDKGKPVKFERTLPQKVRTNPTHEMLYTSDDWSVSRGVKWYPNYKINSLDTCSMLSFWNFVDSPGQDIYPLVKEISCFNWCYLDGQSSTLHKKNIEKSIFPSLVIRRPKAFLSPEERDTFKKNIQNNEGEIVTAIVLAENGFDNVPTVESFPTSNNDKLFLQTDERIDGRICAAHSIDPILCGIRVTGKLGGGTDIQQAYPIFEKNVILPLRGQIEDIMNDILMVFGIKGEFVVNEFRIVDGQVIEEEEIIEPTTLKKQ